MSRAAAVRADRSRPVRAVALLMLAMLVVQLAAQWCAWHCGELDAARGAGGLPWREAGVAAQPAVADALLAEAPAACTAAVWCELGQSLPLPSIAALPAALPPSGVVAAPCDLIAAFLRVPEERPPTA